MAYRRAIRPLVCNNVCDRAFKNLALWLRNYSTSTTTLEPAKTMLDPSIMSQPTNVDSTSEEKTNSQSLQPRASLGGSRRSRAATQSCLNAPFEQLPYQCFQEARKVLQRDREEKVRQIQIQRHRIAMLSEQDPSLSGGEKQKNNRLESMRKRLEHLKILADVNDPLVKKKFEDAQGWFILQELCDAILIFDSGDMSKPVYRHLAERKWRSYKRLLTMQRISQFHIVPDILHKLEPTAEVGLGFGRKKEALGQIVPSQTSKTPGKLFIKLFNKGERLISVVLIDPDVPNFDTDGFEYRCHFLAANIPASPTVKVIPLDKLSQDSQVILPWLPPYAQKGSPNHRLAFFVLEHSKGDFIDITKARAFCERKNFKLRSFMDKFPLAPIGFDIFRTQWDSGMDDLMYEMGVEGIDSELRKKRVGPLPYKKKDGARFR